jgi:hypothetical protein
VARLTQEKENYSKGLQQKESEFRTLDKKHTEASAKLSTKTLEHETLIKTLAISQKDLKAKGSDYDRIMKS